MTQDDTPTQLAAIERALRAQTDPVLAVPMKAYMLGQFEFLGVRAGPRREALKALSKFTGTADGLLELADALWRLPEREFRYAAIDLLSKHHKKLDMSALPRLLALVQTDAWWDTVDGLAAVVSDLLLHALASQPEVQNCMDDCLLHHHLWVRRVAMLHQLGWKERTDTHRLYRYALTLAPENDFFIRKAIGWALRDHARTQPDAVRAFLLQHEEVLSGLTRREAGKHLGKNPNGD
jgi:3-methyladenine DNA glycosylase AlkD